MSRQDRQARRSEQRAFPVETYVIGENADALLARAGGSGDKASVPPDNV